MKKILKITIQTLILTFILMVGFSFNKVKAATSNELEVIGAQVRLEGNAGIKFVGEYTGSESIKEYGILFALGEVEASNIVLGGNDIHGASVTKKNENNQFSVTIYDIPEDAYVNDITARAYIVLQNDTIVYAETATTRSLAEVVISAHLSGQTGTIINVVKEYVEVNYKKAYFDNETNNYTITDPISNIDGEFVKIGSEIKLPKALNAEQGYKFDGWYLGEVKYNADSAFIVTNENLEFVPKFKSTNYTVTYELNGGNWNYSSRSEVVNELINDFNNIKGMSATVQSFIDYTSTGYNWFAGTSGAKTLFADSSMRAKWSWLINYVKSIREAAGLSTNQYESLLTNGYVTGDAATINVELIAFIAGKQYAASGYASSNYMIESNNNGFWDVLNSNEKLIFNYDIELETLPIPKRKDYTFDGWYLTSDFSGEKITSLDYETKLYANWKPNFKEYSLTLNVDGGTCEYTNKTFREGTLVTLPIPTKVGYFFDGWYFDDKYLNKCEEIITITSDIVLYAYWQEDDTTSPTENILSLVSDVATSNTKDTLISENEEASFKWTSSNNNLYNIKDGLGTVSKQYQTHKQQKVTISVEISYKDGLTKTKSKEITIDPVLYEDMSSSPVATYFSTGAMYAYKQYCERYLNEGTIFSNNTKEVLDVVYYAFVNIDASGNCSLANSSYLEEVKELKNHNVRIIACVSGVSSTTSGYFQTITANATLLKTFINNLMNLVEQYNFDGLDIDWEAVNSSIRPDAASMNKLMKGLREEMTNRQDPNGTPYYLSAAVPASSWGTASDRFDFTTLNSYVDYINLMSYDLNKGDSTTHLSPLYSSSKDGGYGFGCDWGVSRLSSLGLTKGKVIIGSAGYGKAYKVTGTSTSSTHPYLGVSGSLTIINEVSSAGSFASGTLYGSAIEALLKTGKYTKYIEYNSSGKLVGTYLYNSTDNIFVTYDGEEAIKAKYQYALDNKVGIMNWCYSEDTAENYVNSIYQVMNSK